tara:strand:+ start:410 stop:544 length:135 start_codon:yes stop_codon:yes gene_type:complete
MWINIGRYETGNQRKISIHIGSKCKQIKKTLAKEAKKVKMEEAL